MITEMSRMVTVENTTITTQSSGSNGVVATGGATAAVQQTTIETHANSSRGLHATYKGTINIWFPKDFTSIFGFNTTTILDAHGISSLIII